MKYQIGFYCPHITAMPHHRVIVDVLNGLTTSSVNTIMFNTIYEQTDNDRKFCLLPSVNARYFYGILFCFDVDSLSVTDSFPGPSHKVFVTDSIVWQNKYLPSTTWNNLLSSKTKIVTLNKKIYDLYSICFNQPILNMEDGFNLQECQNVIQSL